MAKGEYKIVKGKRRWRKKIWKQCSNCSNRWIQPDLSHSGKEGNEWVQNFMGYQGVSSPWIWWQTRNFRFLKALRYGCVTALEKSCIVGSIPSNWKTLLSYYHSFGLSENYVVFIEQPLTLNGLRLLTMLVKDKSLRECLEWRPQEKVRTTSVKISYHKARDYFSW